MEKVVITEDVLEHLFSLSDSLNPESKQLVLTYMIQHHKEILRLALQGYRAEQCVEKIVSAAVDMVTGG